MNEQVKTEQPNEAHISPSALNDGLERTELTEDELTKLMFASSRDKFINCAYGKNGVDLLPTEGNKWAFDMIAEMRSNVKVRGDAPLFGAASLSTAGLDTGTTEIEK